MKNKTNEKPPGKVKKKYGGIGDIILRQRAKGDMGDMVSVQVMRGSDIMGPGVNLRVQVYSQAKPGSAKRGEKFFSVSDPEESVSRMAEVLGGSLAEECCITFGDFYDPEDFAKAAKEAFRKVLVDLEQYGRLTRGVIKA
jgi:hypothetical protein